MSYISSKILPKKITIILWQRRLPPKKITGKHEFPPLILLIENCFAISIFGYIRSARIF